MQEGDFPRTNRTPALAADTIHQNLIPLGFSAREIGQLFQLTEFFQIPYRSHQLCFFQQCDKESLDYRIQMKELAMCFQMNERTVRKNLQQSPGSQVLLGDTSF
jgi:hypothetical protein